MLKAVLFDFGGVLTSSPFEAFDAYERRVGAPRGVIRRINSTNPHSNAWARLERAELGLDEFVVAFEREAAAVGVELSGAEVLACLKGRLRPEMVEAVRLCGEQFVVALLTNNLVSNDPSSPDPHHAGVLGLFDVVVESSVVGCRKPEERFYEIALHSLGVSAEEAVFLDDLGVNLKPARSMGMATIKVVDPAVAITELEVATRLRLRGDDGVS